MKFKLEKLEKLEKCVCVCVQVAQKKVEKETLVGAEELLSLNRKFLWQFCLRFFSQIRDGSWPCTT